MQNKKDTNQAIDVDDLDAHKNVWFVRTQESIDNEKKEELTKQLDNLALTKEQKTKLKKALETLYDKRKEDSKPNMSFEVKDNILIVKSHN
jgi:hypothetical protein